MKYTLTDIRFGSSDLDNEVLMVDFVIHLTEPEKVEFKNFVMLSELLIYTKQRHPHFYQYWESTRKRTDRMGPAEAATLDLAGDSAVDQLISFLLEYVDTNQWIQKAYAHYKQIQGLNDNPENSATLETIASDLMESASRVYDEQKRYRQFCEQVNYHVRKVATEMYPEIENMDSKRLLHFQNLFIGEIIAMEQKLCEFMNE